MGKKYLRAYERICMDICTCTCTRQLFFLMYKGLVRTTVQTILGKGKKYDYKWGKITHLLGRIGRATLNQVTNAALLQYMQVEKHLSILLHVC